VSDRPRDPLASTTRLVVDGTNLLHAMARGPQPSPPATLVGRLRAMIPAAIDIDLVFDGPAERGLRGERIAAGVHVRYSGARTADAVIVALVDDARHTAGPDTTGGILVVTDDRALRHALHVRGARSAGAAWLIGRLERGRLAAPAPGNPRPRPVGERPAGETPDDDDRPGWQPGRGATSKRGPARRARRRRSGC